LGPVAHTGVSVAIGAGVWAATGEPLSVPVAFAAGALNDTDHLLDYYNWFFRRRGKRLFLIFHGWEYVIAGAVVLAFAWHPLLLAGVLGHLSHVALDTAANNVHKGTYSVAFRVARGFRTSVILNREPASLSVTMGRLIPLWRLIEPVLMRLGPYRRAADYVPKH
jgi:hypothetical protein